MLAYQGKFDSQSQSQGPNLFSVCYFSPLLSLTKSFCNLKYLLFTLGRIRYLIKIFFLSEKDTWTNFPSVSPKVMLTAHNLKN